MTFHDLIDFGGSFISLRSIRAIHNETEYDSTYLEMRTTGNVLIDFGSGLPLVFEGCAADVIKVINKWHADAQAEVEASWPQLPETVSVRDAAELALGVTPRGGW